MMFSSVTHLCPTLCNPMYCSMPGFPVHHQLPEPTQTRGHRVSDAIQTLILCCPLLLLSSVFTASGSFPISQLFSSCGQSIGALGSVLPMNFQGCFPLGFTCLISLLSKGLSRVFFSTTVRSHKFLALSFLNGPTLISIYDCWKNHSFDYMDLC